ncbi:MAG TPA: dienelactone hydrolase family protein [Polyangiaceae bacterium]|jgi:dienelactone hydrolase
MRTRLSLAAGAVVAALLVGFLRQSASTPTVPSASAAATPPPLPRPDVDASSGTFHVEFKSGPYRLHGDVFKPAGTGPFPVLVYNHGSEKDPGLDVFQEVGEFFQAEGYVAFFPYRRGSADSEGPYWEDEVNKAPKDGEHRAVIQQLDAQAEDVLAAIAWVKDQPYVNRDRVSVSGCSFGGIETVLAAEKSKDIFAAVDFAGASMSWDGSIPLQDRMKTAVRAAHVPIFFLQAENDFNTAPSRELSKEMTAAGKPNAMKIFPPHGTSHMGGHAGFCTKGAQEWGPDVLTFLMDPRKAVIR